jgi:hypothetical protein
MKTTTLFGKAFAVALAVALTGCATPAKFTGGGWLPSTSGGARDKANLGFNMQNCDPGNTPISGHFNYHDMKAPAYAATGGVKLGGFVVNGGACTLQPPIPPATAAVACDVLGLSGLPPGFCPPDVGAIGIDVEYESTNPKLPGAGTAIACVFDGGEGINATSDLMRFYVIDGPFAGYLNQGTVKGNLQQHACTCVDGLDNEGDGLVDADDPSCQLVRGINGSEY